MTEPEKQYSDSEIWSRLMVPDQDCIRWIIQRFGGGLVIHLERIVKSRQTAHDIFSEALATAVAKIKTYDPDRAAFSTWLYRIARNKAIDSLRRQKKEPILFELLTENTDKAIPYGAVEDEDAGCSAIMDLFRRSFSQLTEEERDLLRLRHVSDWSHKEIANRFRTTENNSRVRLKRATERLRNFMEKNRSEGGAGQ